MHSFRKEDRLDLDPDKPNELVFDLFPTSYLFQKGHKIRIRILSNDMDHFKNYNSNVQEVKLVIGGVFSSGVDIPMKTGQY